MVKIKWIGIVNSNYKFKYKELPDNAVKIKMFKPIVSFIFGITAFLLSLMILFIKRSMYGQMPINKLFIPLGCLIGAIFIVLHEILHAIVYPNGSIAYIGINKNIIMPFEFCATSISKTRFIISSLLPTFLGIIPLMVFLLCPLGHKILLTFLWTLGTVGLSTPGPDYADIVSVIMQVPNGSFIQSSEDGFYWFKHNNSKL